MSTLTSTRRLIVSTLAGLAIVLTVVIAPLYAQYRQVDQGKPTTNLVKGWPMRFCDTSGNCIVMTLVGATYAVPVTQTGTSTVSGTVQANAGTGTFNMTCISGCGGAATFSDASAFTFGTTPIGNIGAVVDDVATNTVAENSAAIPRMSSNRVLFIDLKNTQANTTNLNVTATGTMSVTSGTIGSITMPSLTVTSATVGSITMPSLTVTSATVGQMPSLSVTSGTIGSLPSISVTSGTIGQLPSVSVTSGTIGNTVTISPTGTQSINIAQVLAAAMSTANPVISGGRAATDTVAAVANGAAVAQAMDKFGRIVIVPAPQDMWVTGTFTLTATTASTPTNLTAPGANYRFALTGVYACSTANALTRLDVRDNTTAVVPFVWVQTATTAGEPKCWSVTFNPPFLMTANQPITVALATAVTDVRGVISAYKTGT